MFLNINFKNYAAKRVEFYNKLSQFVIDENKISNPIELDQNFFRIIDTHFQQFLIRRKEKTRFTKAENIAYKQLIRNQYPEILPIFRHLGPAIYWFKINYSGDLTNKEILKCYSSAKEEGSGWWTQVNLARNNPTEILYLGKVETTLQNRFIQHIGLGHNFTTSLKLQRWMPSLVNMTVTFQFLAIDSSMKPYLEDIENVLWQQLKPLLGAAPRIKN